MNTKYDTIELESGIYNGAPYTINNWINLGYISLHIQPTYKNKEMSIELSDISLVSNMLEKVLG